MVVQYLPELEMFLWVNVSSNNAFLNIINSPLPTTPPKSLNLLTISPYLEKNIPSLFSNPLCSSS